MNNSTNSSSFSPNITSLSNYTTKDIANYTRANIVYNGNTPSGKNRRVRAKGSIPKEDVNVKSLWERFSERVNDWWYGKNSADKKKPAVVKNKFDKLSSKALQRQARQQATKHETISRSQSLHDSSKKSVRDHAEKKKDELVKNKDDKSSSKTSQRQVRNLQQATKDVVISSPQYLFNASITSVKFSMCVSGNEGLLITVDLALKRIVQLFKLEGGALTRIDNATQAITAQFPGLGFRPNFEVSCQNGHYHLTSTIYPSNTTLYHAVVKNQTLTTPEYIAGQVRSTVSQSFRVAKLSGNLAALAFGTISDFQLLLNNQNQRFSEPGQFVTLRSAVANILSLIGDGLRIFQYVATESNQDIPFNITVAGINHISNQTELICQNTPAEGPFVGLISGNAQVPYLHLYDINVNKIVSNRSLGTDMGINPPSIADYGSGIYVYAREVASSVVTGAIDIGYDFIDVSNNMVSVIGGERIYPIRVTSSPKLKVAASADGTAIITYTDDIFRINYIMLNLVDLSIPTPSIEVPSSIQVPEPSIQPPSSLIQAPSPIQSLSPSIQSLSPSSQVLSSLPTINTGNPTIVIIPPINLNQTLIPITPEIIQLDGNIIKLTITDKNGYKFVFNANCSDVPEGMPFSITDLYNMSIALGNGTINKIPSIEACNIEVCTQSVSGLRLSDIAKLDDNTLIIALPILAGVLVLIAVGGTVWYFKKFKPLQERRQAARDKNHEMSERVRNHVNKIRLERIEKRQRKMEGLV